MQPQDASNQLVDHLFRHEAGKMVAVLTSLFGFDRLDVAEDLVQDTFLQAFETWKLRGMPENPVAWLYKVAKNKAFNYVNRQSTRRRVDEEISSSWPQEYSILAHIENAFQQISDSQLQMLFAVTHPAISPEATVALALKTLCGFSVEEIARSFLTSKETIQKRLYRARERIRQENIRLEAPSAEQLPGRLQHVLQCLYLLFNEGYYSASQEAVIRKDLCLEAMRLCLLLLDYPHTRRPEVFSLLALMCFHASRFDSRFDEKGGLLSWSEQDQSSWNTELIQRGTFYLQEADAFGEPATSYQLEAMIAFFHTQPHSPEKWQALLTIYERLTILNHSPVVALNRAYVLAQVAGPKEAVEAVLAIPGLKDHLLYQALLGELYQSFDPSKALFHWQRALRLATLEAERQRIQDKIRSLS